MSSNATDLSAPTVRPSANGYLLYVGGYQLHASWAAPWFVVALDDPGAPDYDPEPMLIHCETLAAAHRVRGFYWRTHLIASDFVQVRWDDTCEQMGCVSP